MSPRKTVRAKISDEDKSQLVELLEKSRSPEEFISAVSVGPCPSCGSRFTHDCDATEMVNVSSQEEVSSLTREGWELLQGAQEGEYTLTRQAKNICPESKRMDDPLVGHCDECGWFWCTECGISLGKEVSAKEVGEHWGVVCHNHSGAGEVCGGSVIEGTSRCSACGKDLNEEE